MHGGKRIQNTFKFRKTKSRKETYPEASLISKDPFEILEGERVVYENLYKSRRNGSEVNNLNFHFEDLSISTLSNILLVLVKD